MNNVYAPDFCRHIIVYNNFFRISRNRLCSLNLPIKCTKFNIVWGFASHPIVKALPQTYTVAETAGEQVTERAVLFVWLQTWSYAGRVGTAGQISVGRRSKRHAAGKTTRTRPGREDEASTPRVRQSTLSRAGLGWAGLGGLGRSR